MRYHFPLQKNRSILICCQDLNGTSVGMIGFFCCNLATTRHGEQFSILLLISWFIPSQFRCFSLRCILEIPGWTLCNDSKNYCLNLDGISNLPRYAIQPSSMLRLPLRAQYLLKARSSTLYWQGHPWSICWIIGYTVTYFFCLACITDICTGVMHGVRACTVKARPFNSISSQWLTLLRVSASVSPLLQMYLISSSYGCILSNNFVVWVMHLIIFYVNFLQRLMIWLILQTFCHTGSDGSSSTKNTTASISLSILAYLISTRIRAFDAYATGLPSCNNTAPSPTWEASTCNTTYLRKKSSLIWIWIFWNATSCASVHWNNASFLRRPLRFEVK